MTTLRGASDLPTPLSAILAISVAYVLFSVLDASGKYLVLAGVSLLFMAWMRFAVHLVLVIVLFGGWRNPGRFRPKNIPGQLLRSGMMVCSTIGNFLALETLQLAEITSIYFFVPALVTALAGPLLGERVGWRRWMAVVTGFIGVLVITRPGIGEFGIGHLYALGAMTTNAVYVIMTRRMSATETSESMILFSALAPVVFLMPTLPFTTTLPADLWHWTVLLSLGVYGAFGHWLLIRAYRIAPASALAPYPYLQMVWMVVLGWLIFAQLPDVWTLVGAAIIVASGLYIVHRERTLRRTTIAVPNAEDEELAKRL